MTTFVTGQRWISESELDQGLGTVLKIEERRLTLFYSATGETRLYQMENSPLYRMIFNEGDTLKSHEGWTMTVTGHHENEGIITYSGTIEGCNEPCQLIETSIDGKITFTKPQQRMLAGQLSKNFEFNLRYTNLTQYQQLRSSSLLGLTGNRVSLIPHQLHIAQEVGDRFAPRVLLADEVGLGKTIEAGLVLNRQLLTGRSQRVLVIVPETLTHQWLVEMMRRFNLYFTLLNDELYHAIDADNPFDSAQLILTSLEFLSADEERKKKVLDSTWDMLVVDEAHHLQWSESEGGNLEYRLIEKLAKQTPGILLLTATPEQLGREGHFARLRLLDPACFPSLESFYQQEAQYQPIAHLAKSLQQEETLSTSTLEQLRATLDKSHSEEISTLTLSQDADAIEQSRKTLLSALLDRYGISRVLFRNTRTSIGGFPGRVSQSYPLETPELYKIAIKSTESDEQKLYPELLYQSVITTAIEDTDPWWKVDPRTEWLSNFLRLVKEKILVICANASTAIELENSLRITSGQHAAVFHENMSIIERDRAAAWFADEEYGAQLLICSEIGSEGRNFQFVHHLVMFDLPYNPDLLEQRIGRLDRIGQQEIIKIHVPYLEQTPQAYLYEWYNEGINAFDQSCPSASKVFAEQKERLDTFVFNHTNGDKSLITEAKSLSTRLNKELHDGRDFLVELSSTGHHNASLKEEIVAQHNPKQLKSILEPLLECFGVETEEHSKHALILRPGDHMRVSSYPGLPTDGTTVTFDREQALSREDMFFMSWEHPILREGLELFLSSDIGNTAVSLLKNKNLPAGTMLLEAIFVAETTGSKQLHLDAFMPPTVIHTLIDPSMGNLSSKVNISALHQQLQKVKKSQARKLVQAQREVINKMMKKAEGYAKQSLQKTIEEACTQFIKQMTMDIQRFSTLKAVNPNLRQDEVQFLAQRVETGKETLQNASLKLDAVRIIITTH